MPPKTDPISQVELEAKLEELWIRTRRCHLPPPPDLMTFPDPTPDIPLEYPTVATEEEESILRIEARLSKINQINPTTSYYQLDIERRLITKRTGSPRFPVSHEAWPITKVYRLDNLAQVELT
jgi:hypothetical protein